MTTLGIVGCRIFEDEIVHVLVNDPAIERIFIVENEENAGILKKLEAVELAPRVLPFYEIQSELEKSRGFNVVIQLQSMGLHINPARLKKAIHTNVNFISRLTDGVLLFYGLCGQPIYFEENYLGSEKCPVCFLQEVNEDKSKSPLDDCVAVALGGNFRYRKLLKSYRHTFFFTPMWAANWKLVFGETEKEFSNFEFTPSHLKELGYRKVAKIRTGLSYEPDFGKNVEKFAHDFGFEVIELEGSTEIAESSYFRMRNLLTRNIKALPKARISGCRIY